MPSIPSSLHVNDARTWRGGELQTLLLLRGLRARGGWVRLAAHPGGPLARAAAAEDIPVSPLSLAGELDLPGALALAACLREHAPFLVHAHTSRALAATVAARRVVPQLPRLVFSRRVDFAAQPGPFKFGLHKYRAADSILAVSQAAADSLSRAGLEPGRVSVVPDGIDAARFSVPPYDLAAELGLPAGTRLVLNVAALADHKDQRTLIEAAPALLAAHPDVVIAIAGEGDRRAALQSLIERQGLAARVRLLGYREDVPGLLRGAAVAVMCSRLEALGTAALDAMVCGVPLVATRAGGLAALVEAGESGLLVPVSDPAALAAAIGDVLRDDSLAARLSAGGRRRGAEFTADRMVESTIAAYQALE